MLHDFITRNRLIQRREVNGWAPGLGGEGQGVAAGGYRFLGATGMFWNQMEVVTAQH